MLWRQSQLAAVAGAAEAAAAVGREIVERLRPAIFAQITGRGTDDQLHRKQAPGDQAFLRRIAQTEANVDALLDPVSDAVIELDVGLHLGIKAQVFVHHRANSRWSACRVMPLHTTDLA